MTDPKSPALASLGLGLLLASLFLAFAAILAPWWSLRSDAPNSGAPNSMPNTVTVSAKPFDGYPLIEDGEAVTAGLLTLLAILALTGAIGLRMATPVAKSPFVKASPWMAFAGAAMIGLAAVLALTTWPPEYQEFWDSTSFSGDGFPRTSKFYAGVGWYFAVASTVTSIVGGAFAFLRPTQTPGSAAPA